jgi:hypothetical protein
MEDVEGEDRERRFRSATTCPPTSPWSRQNRKGRTGRDDRLGTIVPECGNGPVVWRKAAHQPQRFEVPAPILVGLSGAARC